MATVTAIKQKIATLDSGSFQILCDAYLSKEGYVNIVCLGTKEGTQKTTKGTPDTYFCQSQGKYVFVEYTTQQDNLITKIDADIEKCLDEKSTGIPCEEILEIVYCHTSSNITPENDRKFKEKCEKQGVKFTIIGIDKLANDINSKYKNIAREHLSLPIDTAQIQLADDFIKQYNSNSLAAPIDTPFLFREKEMEEIDAAFENVNVVLLSGNAGTGKTRMALQYAKINSEEEKEKLYCIHDRALPIYDDLCMYFESPGKYFVVVDDANQLSDLSLVVEFANKAAEGYEVKILITVRDYAVEKVKSSINGIVKYEIVEIKVFSDEQIKEIVEKSLGILNEHYLNRIARIASGNARMAILAGKIAGEANRLDSIDDVSDLYSEYFGSVLEESELLSNRDLIISAGIMSFLDAFHLDKIEPLEPFLIDVGLDKECFKSALFRLHELEIVDIYFDKAVKFSEQCFANFILKYTFYDKKIISLSAMIEKCFVPYKNRVMMSVNTLVGIFRDADLQNFVETEIKQLWNKLSDENSPYFMDFIKAFYVVNPTETLIILNQKISLLQSVNISANEIDINTRKNYRSVDDDILTILGGFADSLDLSCALDLFFNYYLKRPDMYIQFYHATDVYFTVDKDSYRNDYYTLNEYVKKIVEFSNNWENEHITLLFLDIASKLLNLTFDSSESNSKNDGIILYTIFLTESEGVRRYRDLIWSHLLEIGKRNPKDGRVKAILRGYAKTFKEESHDVIKADSVSIINIIENLFSPDDLLDNIIVRHLQDVFESSGVQHQEIDAFLNNDKLGLYKLLEGPKLKDGYKYEERKLEKTKRIKQYFDNSSDKLASIKALLEIYHEAMVVQDTNNYEIEKGLRIAIEKISENNDDIATLFDFAIEHGYEKYIWPPQILQKLFSILRVEEVYEKITNITTQEYDNWMYYFFCEVPTELINKDLAECVLSFLKGTTDAQLERLCGRDIIFLEKYQSVDENIYIKGVKLVFEKRKYSEFIASVYLRFLFNKYDHSPNVVIEKFKDNIALLEEIYIWLESYNHNSDTDGTFLFEICKEDDAFLRRYIQSVFNNTPHHKLDDVLCKLRVFYNSDNYIEICDKIFKQLMDLSTYPFSEISDIISRLIIKTEGEELRTQKSIKWIRHFIEENANNKEEMVCLFEAFSQCDTEQRIGHIEIFLSKNNDYDIFKSLPLISFPNSWSGSLVPLYSSWIEFLEKVLPFLSGLKFINHKKLVEERMDDLRKRIIDEQIADIIHG